jgi:chemotaxis protein methyltransferase CheR
MPTTQRTHGAAPAPDYTRFCTGIKSLIGIDLSAYRPGQMERRLRSFAERGGMKDLDEYLDHLRKDEKARDRFKDRMTINVSELFRNPERWQELEKDVIPELSKAGGGLRVWSAGCSYGAEPYSLAILLRELLPGRRNEVTATDIDLGVLERAKQGSFSGNDLRNVSAPRRKKWFEAPREDGGARAVAELRSSIKFGRLDLLKDRFPARQDLILCRNVVIYFEEDAKQEIFRGFFEALRPGGYLLVGSTERINRSEEMGWVKGGTFLYQKPAEESSGLRTLSRRPG